MQMILSYYVKKDIDFIEKKLNLEMESVGASASPRRRRRQCFLDCKAHETIQCKACGHLLYNHSTSIFCVRVCMVYLDNVIDSILTLHSNIN